MAGPKIVTSTRSTVRSGYLLMANTLLTGLTGVLYWALAARLMPPIVLGAGATVISLLTLLSNIGQVNLSYSLPVLLPMAGRGRRNLLRRGLALALAVTLAVSLGYFLLFGTRLPVQLSPALAVFFILCALLWTVFVIEDGALVGVQAAWFVPVSNTVFGLAKLAALVVMFGWAALEQHFDPSVLMVSSWFVPLVVVIPFVLVVLWREAGREVAVGGSRLPNLRHFLAWDYVGGAFYQLGLSMSFFVGVTVGPEAAAAFVAAWTVAQVADLATNNLSAPMGVAVAEAGTPGRTRAEVAIAKRLAVLIPAGVLFTILTAPYLLLLFGRDYVDEATPLLRLLMVALLFKAVTTYCMWGLRGRKRPRDVAIVQILLAVVTVGLGAMVAGQWGAAAYAGAFVVGCATSAVAGLVMLTRAWSAPAEP